MKRSAVAPVGAVSGSSDTGPNGVPIVTTPATLSAEGAAASRVSAVTPATECATTKTGMLVRSWRIRAMAASSLDCRVAASASSPSRLIYTVDASATPDTEKELLAKSNTGGATPDASCAISGVQASDAVTAAGKSSTTRGAPAPAQASICAAICDTAAGSDGSW